MVHVPSDKRYDSMLYRRTGRSGLKLPAISLGLWHNFGHGSRSDTAREMCRAAFDMGITHFDLANNYGPPPGSAESCSARSSRRTSATYRDELIISTKAGYLHVARPLWRVGQPQVPALQPRPEPQAHGARLCRHLLFAPLRSRHAAGRDHGRARYGGAPGQGALCRHLVLSRSARTRRRRSSSASARRRSSTSRAIPSSTAGSRTTGSSTRSRRRAWAASSSRRWRRACSPTST